MVNLLLKSVMDVEEENWWKKSLINQEPLIHSQEYPFSWNSFPNDNLAGVHNCLFMRLHFSIGGYDYRRTTRFRQKYPFQHHSNPFC